MAAKQMMFETDARSRDRQRDVAARPGRQGHPRAARPQRGVAEVVRLAPASPRTASPSPRRSSCQQPFENMGAKLVSMVASKTGDVAGDGTTTATVLAEAIFTEGLRVRDRGGVNPVIIQRGILKAAEIAADAITAHVQEGQGPRGLQARRHHQRQRRREDRRPDGRRHGEGRQGRRHHRRRGQEHRVHPRVHRGHAVRQGLPLALLPDQPDHARSRAGERARSSCTRRRSATWPSCCRC